MTTTLSAPQQREIQRQVGSFLERAPAFRGLSAEQKRQVQGDTARLVERLAEGPRATPDLYAAELSGGTSSRGSWVDPSTDRVEGRMTGNVRELTKNKQMAIGSVIGAGVTQAARMVHEIDFPGFVASLIEGTFHAIVKSSIEQMQAYAEMVKSVSSTLSDFRDQSTTDNQARDMLVERYPQHFHITVVEGQPRIGVREGADDLAMPNFRRDLGMSEDVSSLDDDAIEQQLVPAARDELARTRQQLLATIVLMGINRIVVTDGKINAKLKFQFTATEKQQIKASAFDYVKTGNVYASEGTYDSGRESEYSAGSHSQDSSQGESRTSNSFAKGNYKSSVTPDIKVTSQIDTSSTGALQASGQIMGEVSINFKSETFPLEKMIDSGQLLNLQNAQQGGRPAAPPRAAGGAPADGAAGAAPASGAPAGTTPAPPRGNPPQAPQTRPAT